MTASSPAAVRKQIASGETGPLYLILGDDEGERARLAREFIHVVEEDLRPFNVERLYGGDKTTTIATVLAAARMLPMLAPRRIVILSQAEYVLQRKAAEHDLEAFEQFIQSPEPHATVIVEAGDLDKRRRVVKQLLKYATVVDFGGIGNAGDAQRWVRAQLKRRQFSMDPAAIGLLVDRAGADLARLRADFERVVLYALDRSTIGLADVKAVVGPAVLQDDWAVTGAIVRGKADVALRELGLTFDGGAVPPLILGQLGWVIRTKLPAARIPAAVEAVYRTDLALKTSGGDPRLLLERLVVELCETRGRLRRG